MIDKISERVFMYKLTKINRRMDIANFAIDKGKLFVRYCQFSYKNVP